MLGTTRFYELYDYVKKDCYDQFLKYPIPIREALLFQEIVKQMPIEIKSGDYFAGWYGYETMPQAFAEAPDPAEATRKYIEYKYLTEKDMADQGDYYNKFVTLGSYVAGHTCVKYADIVTKGLDDYRERIEKQRQVFAVGAEPHAYLQAMLISLDACDLFSRRFSDLAKQLAEKTDDFDEKARLMRICEVNRKVPKKPAADIYEAIQAIWTIHILTPISDNNWYSISMGRLDQFLYPFYEASIRKGETDREIINYLKQLYLLLDNYGDGSCAINIGGLDLHGNDQMNRLSHLIIDAELASHLRSPLLAARISHKTPDEVLLRLIDSRLFETGKPAFYGEEVCRRAMMYRNIPEGEAAQYTVSSCMALVMAGEETSDMWGCIFNMHLPLELALNSGKPLHHEYPYPLKTRPLAAVSSTDELIEKYGEYFEEILRERMALSLKTEQHHAHNYPNPLLSVLTRGCIEQGVDRMFGAPYRTTIIETFGLVNTANAVCAMDELVFKKGRYTTGQFLDAARKDFQGYENLLRDIKSCDKYGTNSSRADAIAKRLVDIVQQVCKDMYYDHVRYLPSFHTLDLNVGVGGRLYTTMDGRLAGRPLAKNAGPTNDMRRADPTSLMISAARMEQYRFTGGQPIDLYFDKKMLATADSRKKIASLFRTYFDLGGMQIQVNSIDSVTLRKAYEDPDAYHHLIVKIGGYSMKFNDMTKAKKRELIERIEHEEGLR